MNPLQFAPNGDNSALSNRVDEAHLFPKTKVTESSYSYSGYPAVANLRGRGRPSKMAY
jgi:hypothetical protein